ncbi:restriction endonuclease subunit S [Actinokineospora fastidiosa]|uniref:Restriction endonuclease subunit S n=1 Tax=Actinokineospora fastidiosa TaxID=1816 RepID=A0A918GKX8_9PSEU|nr:restriction endonuclease subunit S [Actinokineospora fastidiosa]GGS44042.1 hypothetical protein GCM10010171_44020 [Actinokineospora fastidiosa]
MSLNLDKSTWKRVRLGDVICRSRKQVDPVASGVERYVAGGHVDTEGVTINRWGQVGDGQMGSTFRYVFEPGQVLFVSARPYLRKVGVPDFSGVVADKTYVLDAVPENGLLHEFLPFVLSSDRFIEYATAEATGSMNPRLLWGQMQRYEFDLPPLDEQMRLADLLRAIERHRRELVSGNATLHAFRSLFVDQNLPLGAGMTSLGEVASISSGITLGPARRAMIRTAPYLRVANVQRGKLDLSEIKDIGATEAEVQTKSLEFGDILVVEGHASIEDIGRAAIWDRDDSPLYQNHLFRVRANQSYRPMFLLEWINSARGRAYIRTVAKSTSGLNTINSTALKEMPIPIVTLEKQDRLLRDLSVIDNGLSALSSELASIMRLRLSNSADIFGGTP